MRRRCQAAVTTGGCAAGIQTPLSKSVVERPPPTLVSQLTPILPLCDKYLTSPSCHNCLTLSADGTVIVTRCSGSGESPPLFVMTVNCLRDEGRHYCCYINKGCHWRLLSKEQVRIVLCLYVLEFLHQLSAPEHFVAKIFHLQDHTPSINKH